MSAEEMERVRQEIVRVASQTLRGCRSSERQRQER